MDTIKLQFLSQLFLFSPTPLLRSPNSSIPGRALVHGPFLPHRRLRLLHRVFLLRRLDAFLRLIHSTSRCPSFRLLLLRRRSCHPRLRRGSVAACRTEQWRHARNAEDDDGDDDDDDTDLASADFIIT